MPKEDIPKVTVISQKAKNNLKDGTEKNTKRLIGLQLCLNLLKQVEGSIEIQSAPDKGTLVGISIPISYPP